MDRTYQSMNKSITILPIDTIDWSIDYQSTDIESIDRSSVLLLSNWSIEHIDWIDETVDCSMDKLYIVLNR